jgi:hypothetical protein
MTAVTYEEIANWNPGLIRRPNKGFILVAPMTVSIPAAFTTGASADFQALTGFESLGLIAKDAPPSFKPDIKSNDIESWGALEATRTDIITRNLTVTFTSQETKRANLELYSGVDLSAISPDGTTNEIQFNDPTTPDTIYNRYIFGMVDGSGAQQITILRILPRATITEVAEQSWSQEQALAYNMTANAKIDPDLGYSLKNVICGPGLADIITAMGFTAVPSVPLISGVTPAGSFGTAGGDLRVVAGQYFTGATAVTLGGTAATHYDVIDDNTLAIITPAKTAGSVNLVVTNATGASAPLAVTYA